MLAIILSWFVISFLFTTFGNFFVLIYNKMSNRDENYNFVEYFLLGMCATAFLLSLTSLWLPSNHYLLFILIVLCIIYWIIRRKYLFDIFNNTKTWYFKRTWLEKVLLILPIPTLLAISLWAPGVFDSFFYHQQFIRWNEEFGIVPGLANLEDRFGFNSNYLLLCAIFTFRFMFGQAIYTMQPLMVIVLIYWIFYEIIKSNYKIDRLALLTIFSVFFILYTYTLLTTTSTDIVPNLIVFYICTYLVLHPGHFTQKHLFAFILPIMLITFKVALVPICLLSICTFCYLIRHKEYKIAIVLILSGGLVIIPWLIRNVIISGYLIYPMYQIDLFDLDWKVPHYVAAAQIDFIRGCGIDAMENALSSLTFSHFLIHDWIANGIYALVLISPFFVGYKFLKKKLDKTIMVVYSALILTIINWLINSPDPRFISGVIMATAFVSLYVVIPPKIDAKSYKILSHTVMSTFIIIMMMWAGKRSYNYYTTLGIKYHKDGQKTIRDLLMTPYSYREQARDVGIATDTYDRFELNNGVFIYIANNDSGGRPVTYDKLPSTVATEVNSSGTSKFQDVGTIEARGSSLKNGFKPKNKQE